MFEVDPAHTTFESLKKWRDDSIDLFKRFIGLKAYKDALNALPKVKTFCGLPSEYPGVSLYSRFHSMFEVDPAHTTFESLKKWRDDSIDLFKRFIGLKAYKDALNALPKIGIADAIVDLVGSGTTSRENNLKEIAGGVISQSQAVLVASGKSLTRNCQHEGKLCRGSS
ncbi:unnamed protein product [Cuscuta campestris]|uniref:ATP phosphoribosyltransferase n=1 Tax=Cuscuta campestris TaxID=132261 RepID=A0A484KCB9_9ASTE|nr:unnamed protein product [Cuscuta campestris]